MNELALFAGAGGGLLASRLLGWNTICAVEIEEYRRKILMQRQQDRIFEHFPIWDDVQTFDGKPWQGLCDIVSGGFPCQDVSAAGKGLGVRSGKHSGLWKEFARIIGEVEPPFAFIENSPLLTSRGLDEVLSDLASMGYSARWIVLGAWHVGGPHKRDRMWILAYSNSDQEGLEGRNSEELSECRTQRPIRPLGSSSADSNSIYRRTRKIQIKTREENRFEVINFRGWDSESRILRVANGVPNRTHRIKAIGDGQVPIVAATAFHILSEGLI